MFKAEQHYEVNKASTSGTLRNLISHYPFHMTNYDIFTIWFQNSATHSIKKWNLHLYL